MQVFSYRPSAIHSIYTPKKLLIPSALALMISSANAWAVNNCTKGNYYDTSGVPACVPAPPGTYVDTDLATTYIPAPKGYFVDLPGQTEPTACASGYFTSNTGQTNCQPATAGHYAAGPGAQSETQCPAGTFTNAMGSPVCTPTQFGYFAAGLGNTSEQKCGMGTFANTTHNAACTNAPAGSFVDTIGAIGAQLCTAGTFSTNVASTSCEVAQAGYFVAQAGQSNALPCPIGSFSNMNGSASCTPAPVGFYAPVTGLTSAYVCPVGTFSSSQGSGSCAPAQSSELNFSQATYSVNENATGVDVTVNRGAPAQGALSVDFILQDGTAHAGEDFEYQAGNLYFANGETSKTINVKPINNSVYSGDKNFFVSLNNLQGAATFGSIDSAQIQITDDEAAPNAGVIALSANSQNVNENAGHATATINRSGGTSGQVTVSYRTQDKSAVAGTDYKAVAGTLTFLAGESQKTVDIPIIDNTQFYANKNFTFELFNQQGGAFLSNNSAVITIVENEAVPSAGVFEIEKANYVARENYGTLSVKINRAGGSQGEARVDIATVDGTAVTTQDFTALSSTLIFADGETQKTVSVTLVNDSTAEDDETFSVQLSNPIAGKLGTQSSAQIKLRDDDTIPAAGIVHLSGVTYQANENDASAKVIVTRANGSTGDVSVNLATSDGSAVSAQDYVTKNITVTLLNGEQSKIVDIPLINDSVYTGNKNFKVSLSNISGGAILGLPKNAQINLVEDEAMPAQGVLQFDAASYSASEGTGKATLTLARSSGSFGVVSVDYQTTNGTAMDVSDFTAKTGTVTFNDGELSKTISIDLVNDSAVESSENFSVTLSNPVGATLGTTTTAQATITDDDVAETPKSSKGGAMDWWFLLAIFGLGFGRNRKNN